MNVTVWIKFLCSRNLYVVLSLFLTFNLLSQNYPPQENLNNIDYSAYQAPSSSLPGYLSEVTGSTYGNSITRVSDKGVFGTTSARLRHNYAVDQVWNSDGSLIKLAGYPAAILDGETYEFLYWANIPSYGRWSNTQPNIIYGTSGNKFVQYNVSTDQTTVLHTFSNYSSIDFGYGEGTQDNNDQYVGLIGNGNTLIVYDIQNDNVVGTKNIPDGDLDWFSVSSLGNYAIASWRPDGSGTTQGMKRYNIDMTNETHIYDYTAHGDFGIDASGNEVFVQYGNDSTWNDEYYLVMIRFSNAQITPLYYYPQSIHGESGIWGGHISCRNINRPGWAYVSEGCCTDHPTASREIFAIKLDASNTVERYAKHHSDYDSGYGHESMAVPNRNGTKVIFASNWNNSGLMNDANPPAWIVSVPQAGSTPTVVASAGEDVDICEGGTTTLTANGGSSYVWSTGATSQSIEVSPDETTVYSVTVSQGGVSDSDEVQVTVNPLPTANAGEDVTICEGESVSITATGGNSYEWSTGSTNATTTVSPNSTTTYTVTVVENGCSSEDEITVTVNPLPEINLGSDITIEQGDTANLSVNAEGSIEWSTGETTNEIVVNPNQTTTYVVYVTNNGCTSEDSITVNVNQIQVVASAGENVAICEGGTTTLTASGGSSYEWSTGATTQSIDVSPNETTVYSVTVSQGGVSDSDEVQVTVNALPTADAGSDVSMEVGSTVVLTATGGEGYQWSNGATTQSIEVSPSATTTYEVTVTTGECSSADSVTVTVTQPETPELVVSAGNDVTICEGSTAVLTASEGESYQWNNGATTQSIEVSPNTTTEYTVTVSQGEQSGSASVTVNVNALPTADAGSDVSMEVGSTVVLTATGGESYQWSNGATTQSIEVSPSATTTYEVTVTTGECSSADSVTVTVTQPETPELVVSAGNDVTICEGSTAVLTASEGESYQWNNGATTQSIEVSPNTTTEYTVTVSQGEQSGSASVTVNVNALPTADAGSDVSMEVGSTVVLTATGGEGYQWSNGATTQSIEVSPSATTTYEVTVTTGECSSTDSVTVTVTQPETPELVVSAGDDVTICEGSTAVLTASEGESYQWNNGATTQSIEVSPNTTTEYTVTVSQGEQSGSASVTVNVNALPTADAGSDVSMEVGSTVVLTATGGEGYQWSNGATTQSIEVSPSATTTYEVTVTTGECSSTDSVTVTVTQPETPELVVSAGDDVTICEGSTAVLTASEGESYQWNNGATTQSIEVSPNTTTEYTVTVSQGEQSGSASVTVNVNALPTADAGSDVSMEVGSTVVLTATGGESYQWSNGATTQSIEVSPSATTTYEVTVTTGECSSTDSVTVTVTQPETPELVVSAGDDVTICEGSTAVLTASEGESYQWNNGATTQSIEVSPNTTTEYTVTVSQGEQSGSASVTVNVNALPTADAGSDVSMEVGSTVVLTATGGEGYQWSNGATTQSIEVSPSATTTYEVTVTTGECSSTDSVTVTVTQPETPELVVSAGDDVTICEGSTAVLTASEGESYQWNNGATTQSIQVSPNTTTEYTVTVSQGEQSGSASVTVNVNALPTADAGSDVSMEVGSTVVLTATGGESYQWSNGATTQSIEVSPSATTTYEVTVTTGECSSIDSVIVNVVPLVNAYAGEDEEICLGESVELFAEGGLTYLWSNGATTQSIDVSPDETTEYFVVVSNGINSQTDSVMVLVDQDCNNLGSGSDSGEQNYAFDFSVFPNPTKNFIHIKVRGGAERITAIYLHDMMGNILINEAISATSSTFNKKYDLSHFQNGMYVLTIKQGGNSYTKKIILNQ
ncbi:T9SS type A sorting domain-containing protein [Mangrovimonas sp. CR14]|uniref:T9SS type A sorting domain-containing protein n=1 Tax=Mangrovimonas sp. CR14 TaxID=2706120 RepID=UPI00142047C7|nr:T9SS type A sorting domain-containing protein [Mangrovimonas sp. CR14]NIK91888.1 T9SS type A sorting domain-containing protein [Mangrovimonas sp. CR14]